MQAIFGRAVEEAAGSLLERAQTAPGIEKSSLYNELSGLYWNNDLEKDKVRQYGQKALENALAFNQQREVIRAYANLGQGYKMLNDYVRAVDYANKSLHLAEQSDEKELLFPALTVLGDINVNIPNFKEARAIYGRLLSLAEEMKHNEKIALYNNRIGSCYYQEGNLDLALEFFRRALDLYRGLGNKKKEVDIAISMATLYSRIGNLETAFKYYLEGVKICNDHNMKAEKARVYQGMGSLYRDRGDHKTALEYYVKAMILYKKRRRLVTVLQDIGNCHSALRQYDKALAYLDRALDIRRRIDLSGRNGAAGIYLDIGNVYFKQNDYARALSEYRKALTIAGEFREYRVLASCRQKIGQIYYLRGQYRDALAEFLGSFEMAKTTGENSLILENYDWISRIYNRLGQYKNALDYFRLYSDLKDNIYNQSSAKKLAEMQTRYETEKKEREIEYLTQNAKLRELTMSRQRLILKILIVGLVLALALMALIIKQYHYLFTFWKKKHYIGHYKVIDKIASGGMGTVYKAHDIKDKSRELAVKVLREEYFNDAAYKKRFRNEAVIIEQLDHPNIVKIIERGEHDGNLYIAMELLEGQTLSEFMNKKGKTDLDIARSIMLQAADALAGIHKKNIIHRDLKPENIMIVEVGHNPHCVKVLDFGLSKTQSLTRLTQTGVIMGTIHYLSPEQLANSDISWASDIYSLGVIFYQLICGQQPFFGDSAMELVRQILENDPIRPLTFRAEIPAGFNDLVMRMLDKKPANRPSAREVFQLLSGVN